MLNQRENSLIVKIYTYMCPLSIDLEILSEVNIGRNLCEVAVTMNEWCQVRCIVQIRFGF